MLKPLCRLECQGLLHAAIASVVQASMLKRVSPAGESIAARPVGLGKAKSVLIALRRGGKSQLDTLDREPDAPAEVRGEFTPTSTKIPSVAVCEHLPKVSQQTDRWATRQTWNTHFDNWGRLRNRLLPPLDQGLAALTDDAKATGLLDEMQLIVMGEFGRTQKVATLPGQTIPGRNPWAHAYSGLFAGSRITYGHVLDQTDAQSAYPATNSRLPAGIHSAIFNALGVDSSATLTDPLDRPHHLLNDNVIWNLYAGAAA